MTGGGSSIEALAVGSAFMGGFGELFPARLKLSGEQLEFLFVLPDHRADGEDGGGVLDHPLVEVRERIRSRGEVGAAHPAPLFFVDAGGRWARLRVEFTGTAVRALIVMPEAAPTQVPGVPFHGAWQGQMSGTVKLALDEIARMLARCRNQGGGAEPLIDLELAYRHDRNHRVRTAGAHEAVREFIAPVRPVLKLRWPVAASAQRKAFLENLAEVTRAGKWPRRRLTTRIMGVETELPAWITRD
ncbi:hypothetical protein [Amycolatopsis sp. YIM 10]|uniref:hypothetical protein n=1 Tax=Amycolatopsis sp. YIM 10 TaxID=2653857 RepID=UPI0012900076|nr:hypothetical protein [Amycolatopsis sp. YIM 10]QFU89947.1 hypothetical protein YIM_23850 [Amycolatopsis sp. YIM 10]